MPHKLCEHSAASWSMLDEDDMMFCGDCESIIVREPDGSGWRPIGAFPKRREEGRPESLGIFPIVPDKKQTGPLAPSEVAAWPREGQFWARLNPLALIQIKTVGELAGNGRPGMFELHAWTPLKEDETLYVPPMSPTEFRFLWYAGMHYRRGSLAGVEPGDVLLVGGDRLLFVGPHTDELWAHILADWAPPEVPDAKLYQPGPRRIKPKGNTVYDRLRNPEV